MNSLKTEEQAQKEWKEFAESLIKRLDGLEVYLQMRLEKRETQAEIKLLLEYKNLLRDIQIFIEKYL